MTKKRALVTGGSGAIGSAIAERLAVDGYAVLVHAHRHPESAEQVVEKIRAHGGSALSVSFDIVDGGATRLALETLLKEGPIQVLVNNAGLHDDAPMAGMTSEQWTRCHRSFAQRVFQRDATAPAADDRDALGTDRVDFIVGGHDG